MKQYSHLLSLPSLVLAILILSSLPSIALALTNSNSNFPKKTSAASSNLFRRSEVSIVCSRYGGARKPNHALFAAANAASLPPKRDVEVRLGGLFGRNTKSRIMLTDPIWLWSGAMSFRKRVMEWFKFLFFGGLVRLLHYFWVSSFKRSRPVTVYDARAKEIEEGLSKADFFEKYGFVILDAKSAMTAEDWEASDRDIMAILKEFNTRDLDGGSAYNKRIDAFRNAETPVKRIYAEEVKELLQSIVPRAKTIMPPAKGIRRTIGGGIVRGAVKSVHNDYGLIFDEVVERNPYFDFDKQRKIYDEMNADEFMLVNFWRPIKPMSTALRSAPLCFLDASTLSKDDFVLVDTGPSGLSTNLKENPNHKFYFYPDMTVDEVVVFKQFHRVRNETIARMPVFHTAFPDPAADDNTEGRVSFEYRVSLLA